MSLVIAIKGTGGLVLAADTRSTHVSYVRCDDGTLYGYYEPALDGFSKFATLAAPHAWVGIALYGNVQMDTWTHLRGELEGLMAALRRGPVLPQPSNSLLSGTTGIVVGFDEGADSGRVFVLDVEPDAEPVLVEHHAGTLHHADTLGITYGGVRDVIDRLLQGFDARLNDAVDARNRGVRPLLVVPIPLATMSLAECVDFARFLIQTTIDMERFSDGKFRAVGGPIELLTITAGEGLQFVQRAEQQTRYDGMTAHVWYDAPSAVVMHTPDGQDAATYDIVPDDGTRARVAEAFAVLDQQIRRGLPEAEWSAARSRTVEVLNRVARGEMATK